LHIAPLGREFYPRSKEDNMNMRFIPKLKTASAGLAILAVVGLVPCTLAAETEYSGTFCLSSKVTVLESNPEITIYIADGTGITTPGSSTEPFVDATVRCVNYARIVAGARTAWGSCRWVDPSGDTIVGETVDTPGEPGKWTFLAGTGKWKGIQGGGPYKYVTKAKPAQSGTGQLCISHSGKYTLP
jgi:hypothetical protein